MCEQQALARERTAEGWETWLVFGWILSILYIYCIIYIYMYIYIIYILYYIIYILYIIYICYIIYIIHIYIIYNVYIYIYIIFICVYVYIYIIFMCIILYRSGNVWTCYMVSYHVYHVIIYHLTSNCNGLLSFTATLLCITVNLTHHMDWPGKILHYIRPFLT